MLRIRRWVLILVVCGLATCIFLLNFFLMNRLTKDQISKKPPETKIHDTSAYSSFVRNVSRKITQLGPGFLNQNPRSITLKRNLLKLLKPADYADLGDVFKTANSWPVNNEIYPESFSSGLGQLIRALQQEEVLKTYNSNRGTQLKLVLKFQHGQPVLFKPAWYSRDTVIEGQVYSGKDRHNAEIVAFYLGALLGMRWTPIAVGRRLSLEEVHRKADSELKSTMLVESTKFCVYGKCFYCTPKEPVCGQGERHEIEGALLYLIPGTLQKHLSPWQRTYKADKQAVWETDWGYCQGQRKKLPAERLLDIIDIAIFDYLIQNGDRHRHESRNGRLVLVDNGKGFGNPHVDHLDILAPLYHCCQIRKSTYERLKLLTGGALSDILDELTKADLLYPLLTRDHLVALDKRLLNIYGVLALCEEKLGRDHVLQK